MKLLLRNRQAAGDALMLTAAVRDLHRSHPGAFETAVDTSYPELWQNNPYVVAPGATGKPDRVIDCEYPLIHEANSCRLHFVHGFVLDLERKLGLSIPVSELKGDIHFSQEERSSRSPLRSFGHHGPYWVIVAGGKFDFTTKWWNPDSYQSVVDHFTGRLHFVQCGNSNDWHPPLRQVLNLVGKTSLRQLIQLIYHAEGVICPVTLAMHLAAAVPVRGGSRNPRPCVVIAGGREPPSWEQYPGHHFLHTIGTLDCCATGGCWKSRCQPLGDGEPHDKSLCLKPVRVREDLQIARCMEMIKPEAVIDAIEQCMDGPQVPNSEARPTYPRPELSQREEETIHVSPRGVAVTIGIGRFEEVAELAAREVAAKTGLDAIILGPKQFADSGLEQPAYLKFRLFDLVHADNILYFDADMVCLERWDVRAHFGGPAIVAVRDRMIAPVRCESDDWGIPIENYFNAGMFIASKTHHRAWLKEGERLRFAHPTGLFDQSALNLARCRLNVPLTLLDRRVNWLGFGGNSLSLESPVVMAHKLAPDRVDLNVAYFQGKYELPAPRITFNQPESDRLCGRTFVKVESGIEGDALTLRADGTVFPPAPSDREGYWFVHDVQDRPTLALASEDRIVSQYIETLGGDWIQIGCDTCRLIDQTNHRTPPLTEQTARDAADRFLASLRPYPDGRYRGRGIVICAGGEKYLPCAWVCIRMLRGLGCQLPIELWSLRENEIPRHLRSHLEQLGVRCVNAGIVRRQHPVRFLSGWELKPYSILHSEFEQVLYLDADNVPVADPSFLFDAPEFRKTGAVFWPDYLRLGPDREIWRICGVPYRDEPEFESGQMLIDKQLSWRPLQLTVHLNEHSDFYYRYIHGDKETFHMAWRMTGQEYAMISRGIESLSHAMCQHDFAGRRLFQHRNFAKWLLFGENRRIEGFKFEDRCLEYLEDLRKVW